MIRSSFKKLLVIFALTPGVAKGVELPGGPYQQVPIAVRLCEDSLHYNLIFRRTNKFIAATDAASELLAGIHLMRENGKMDAPHKSTLLFTLGPGPGMTGAALRALLGSHWEALNNFDVAEIYPPGTLGGTLLSDIPKRFNASLYERQTWITWYLLSQVLEPGQMAVGAGHSYGGIMLSDLLAFNQSLPSEMRLNISHAIFIASPMSKHALEDVIPERRKGSQPKEWKPAFQAYSENPTVPSFYKQLFFSYGPLLFHDGKHRHAIQQLMKFPASPLSLLYIRKSWEPDNGDLKKLAEIGSDKEKGVKMYGFGGDKDGLLPWELMESDYRLGGIEPILVPGGSHFPFWDDLRPFSAILAKIYFENTVKLGDQGGG